MSNWMLGKGAYAGDILIGVRFLILVRFFLVLKTRFYAYIICNIIDLNRQVRVRVWVLLKVPKKVRVRARMRFKTITMVGGGSGSGSKFTTVGVGMVKINDNTHFYAKSIPLYW